MISKENLEKEIRNTATFLAQTTNNIDLVDKTKVKKRLNAVITMINEISSKL